jgi:GMP synthase (glutamine-hydrolysing)
VVRYAVISCEDAPRWAGHEQNWIDLLARPGDEWAVYQAWAGELPSPTDHLGYVLTGSHHSVNDDTQTWLEPLFDFVRGCAERDRRVFGACFGLQVMTRAFGGRVGPNPGGRFAFGSERIELEPDYFASPIAAGEPPAMTFLISHGEQAIELPPGARRLARSASAENEIIAIGDTLLATQFHAEFTPAMVLEKILPRLQETARLDPDEQARALASLEAPLDSAHFIAAIRRFLSG